MVCIPNWREKIRRFFFCQGTRHAGSWIRPRTWNDRLILHCSALILHMFDNRKVIIVANKKIEDFIIAVFFLFIVLCFKKWRSAKWRKMTLNGFVIELRLQFLVVGHLTNGLHEIFFNHVIAFCTNGEQTSFRTNVSQIGTVKTIR